MCIHLTPGFSYAPIKKARGRAARNPKLVRQLVSKRGSLVRDRRRGRERLRFTEVIDSGETILGATDGARFVDRRARERTK